MSGDAKYLRGRDSTYGKEKVDRIHQTENHISDLGMVIAITGEQQATCYYVMREHLPMILPSFLDMDDYDLLQPEGKLGKNVPLSQTINLSIWPICP
jgi:hypothetical protein